MGHRQPDFSRQPEHLQAYLDGLTQAAGHADRVVPIENYTKGLILQIERKSVDRQAALSVHRSRRGLVQQQSALPVPTTAGSIGRTSEGAGSAGEGDGSSDTAVAWQQRNQSKTCSDCGGGFNHGECDDSLRRRCSQFSQWAAIGGVALKPR